MKVIGGLERSNQHSRLLADGIGKIRYNIWFWLLIISFLMLFNKSISHIYSVYEQETQTNQKNQEAMSQISNHGTSAASGLIYKSENELIECKGNSDKPVFLGVMFLFMVYVGVYFANHKVLWLDYVFFSGYLQKLIQYIYLSDGKKRRFTFA